jgi:N-acylneuraminate cytidylyltransferase
MKLAIIPARGGSQRIPKKNIRLFCGHPIIKYSIEAAINSDCFDEVMVSTDDERIAEIALSYGAKVPFMRSVKNSSNVATTVDVILEVLREYRVRGLSWDYFCCLYPTAPFASADLLKNALSILLKNKGIVNSVFPIVKYSHPIQRALFVKDGMVHFYSPDKIKLRTQDLEVDYHDAGQFYWIDTNQFLKSKEIFGHGSMGIVIPEVEVQDIDNEMDWLIAEIKFRLMNKTIG